LLLCNFNSGSNNRRRCRHSSLETKHKLFILQPQSSNVSPNGMSSSSRNLSIFVCDVYVVDIPQTFPIAFAACLPAQCSPIASQHE